MAHRARHRDQPAVAARVIHHRLGIRVQSQTGIEELRAAICHVLDQPSYLGWWAVKTSR